MWKLDGLMFKDYFGVVLLLILYYLILIITHAVFLLANYFIVKDSEYAGGLSSQYRISLYIILVQ